MRRPASRVTASALARSAALPPLAGLIPAIGLIALLTALPAPAQSPALTAAEPGTSAEQSPQIDRPDAAMPEGISHFTLPNGLEAVVIEDDRAPVVVQMVWYRIGAADEAPGKSGIAHYLEHLMFKGTETLGPGELSRIVTANGGRDNAFTSWDFTGYFQRIASDRLDLIMRMEADRMANLRVSDEDWQAERQVVLEERAQRVDSNPTALFAEEFNAVLYDNHPYGRPIIGWRDEIEALTLDNAMDWYQAHYSPAAAILVIAGDVTPEEVRALAEEHYGPIPGRDATAERLRPAEPPRRSARRLEMSDPRVAQPRMMRAVLAQERDPGEQRQAAALTVLADLLGGSSQTSVLGQRLVLPGKALWAGASYDGLSLDRTQFRLSLIPADGTPPEEAEAALDAVLADFLEEGPDPEALERVKTRIRAAQIYARDSAHGRAYDYGQGLATSLTVQDVNDWPDILAQVTAEDVMAAARDVLTTRGSVTGWLLPEPPPEGGDAPGAAPDLPAPVGPMPPDADPMTSPEVQG
ncbi:insulinase family protein [Paracoccus aestuarii]|uniref:Insulinase family protein n=2 Tax=Paracoccus aestuarii TaxID=453842 RepID=A0A418ZWD0_9RHOB|nr:insulinase family protein [Paracoccus aestuarii]WCQ99385.1 insulinase family protein [Paracoccus aestuarii]